MLKTQNYTRKKQHVVYKDTIMGQKAVGLTDLHTLFSNIQYIKAIFNYHYILLKPVV